MAFQLTYAGQPLILPDADLLAWIERHVRPDALESVRPPSLFAGKNTFGLARSPSPQLPTPRIGEWYYPTTATRWSRFRGLASEDAVTLMVANALPSGQVAQRQTFQITADAEGAGLPIGGVTSPMYLLPPRPLGRHNSQGLYLIELVDERYYWQWAATAECHPDGTTTWADLITLLATALDLTGIGGAAPLAAYLVPEPDSHLWSNSESAAVLLDAVACNIGRTLVRAFDGSYTLQANADAVAADAAQRPTARVAGGGLFDLDGTRQAVLPAKVRVTFPAYALLPGVPHFVNTRYQQAQRPSSWIEDSYGAVYAKEVTLSAAGYSTYQGFPGVKVLRDTAKAILATESSSAPSNQTDLDALALQLAKDYYASLAGAALDEVYPGVLAWTPEAIHDVLWSYREDAASTRVMRAAWNDYPGELQHCSAVPVGFGGRSVAQTIQDGVTSIFGANLVTFDGTDFAVSEGENTNGIHEAVVSFIGGSSSYTADESTLHLTGTVFSIKTTYAGQASIHVVGTLTAGATGTGFTINLGASTVSGVLDLTNGGTEMDKSSDGPGWVAQTLAGQPLSTQTIIGGGTYFARVLNDGTPQLGKIGTIDIPDLSGSYQPINCELSSISSLSSTGYLVRSASCTVVVRTIAGTTNQVAVSNGDGVSGNTVVSLTGPHNYTTQTAHGPLLGQGTSAVAAMSAGTAGQVVVSGGSSADPAWGDVGVPAGAVMWFGYDGTPPAGWLRLTDSGGSPQTISRTTYAAIYAVYGTTWGIGDGSTTFALPPANCFLWGTTGSGGAKVVGATGGVENVTLTAAQSGVPAHNHPPLTGGAAYLTFQAPGPSGVTAGGAVTFNADATTGSNTAADAASSHTNMPPHAVGMLCIKI